PRRGPIDGARVRVRGEDKERTMPRVKRGVTSDKKHRRLMQMAEGHRGIRSHLIGPARESVMRSMAYMYRDRRNRKRDMRRVCIPSRSGSYVSRSMGVPVQRSCLSLGWVGMRAVSIAASSTIAYGTAFT